MNLNGEDHHKLIWTIACRPTCEAKWPYAFHVILLCCSRVRLENSPHMRECVENDLPLHSFHYSYFLPRAVSLSESVRLTHDSAAVQPDLCLISASLSPSSTSTTRPPCTHPRGPQASSRRFESRQPTVIPRFQKVSLCAGLKFGSTTIVGLSAD
ncbi:unnamed protein product [Malus baccata var. baccata]